jgi:homoaconitase
VTLHVRNPDGAVHKIRMRHTLSADQLGWIKAGSALNLIAQAQQQ